MKTKLLIYVFAAIAALAVPAAKIQAQGGKAIAMTLAAGDTVITSASKDTVFKNITASAGYNLLSVQVVTTKGSGTVVGKAYLYGSHDGINYVVSDSSAAFADQTTNVVQFAKSPVYWTYYQVQIRTADGANSTQNNRVKVWYALRRFDETR